MTAISTIAKVLRSELLCSDLIILPSSGATDAMIAAEEVCLARTLSPQHRLLLKKWNGIGLEVVRFFGCGAGANHVGRLADFQIDMNVGIDGALVFGSDASGFVYLEGNDGCIYCLDTDGGSMKELAKDIDDFLDRIVFGSDAAQFAGDDWLAELRESGLL